MQSVVFHFALGAYFWWLRSTKHNGKTQNPATIHKNTAALVSAGIKNDILLLLTIVNVDVVCCGMKGTKYTSLLQKKKKLNLTFNNYLTTTTLRCFSLISYTCVLWCELRPSDGTTCRHGIYLRPQAGCWGIQQAVIRISAELFNQCRPSVSLHSTPGFHTNCASF